MEAQAEKILSGMQSLCSRQECCSHDILAKILRRGASAEDADEILGRLIEDGYVDDLRYSEAFCRDKSSLTGWGPVKIRMALRAKGIPEATISGAIGSIDTDKAADKLHKLLLSKAKTLEGDPFIKLKLIRFALSRGYSYEDVEPAVKELF